MRRALALVPAVAPVSATPSARGEALASVHVSAISVSAPATAVNFVTTAASRDHRHEMMTRTSVTHALNRRTRIRWHTALGHHTMLSRKTTRADLPVDADSARRPLSIQAYSLTSSKRRSYTRIQVDFDSYSRSPDHAESQADLGLAHVAAAEARPQHRSRNVTVGDGCVVVFLDNSGIPLQRRLESNQDDTGIPTADCRTDQPLLAQSAADRFGTLLTGTGGAHGPLPPSGSRLPQQSIDVPQNVYSGSNARSPIVVYSKSVALPRPPRSRLPGSPRS